MLLGTNITQFKRHCLVYDIYNTQATLLKTICLFMN